MPCEGCGAESVDGRFCGTCEQSDVAASHCCACGALTVPELGTCVCCEEPIANAALMGQTLGGRYRVTGILGEGGTGTVYLGEQQMGSTVGQIAIKTLQPHLSKDPTLVARLHRECGIVAQLEHPNTIDFYDFGSTADGTLYIAMELVTGRSLGESIELDGPMLPARVLKIMEQICGALDEAHGQGIIHRDLKPENIMLTDRAGETDFVKLLDFGIAAPSEAADGKAAQTGMVLGTPAYMSPEQFTGEPLDIRSDVYALGVITYEMLTATLPFEADTPWQWATQHMTAQPLPFELTAPQLTAPRGMRETIMRALATNRGDRPRSAGEFFVGLSSEPLSPDHCAEPVTPGRTHGRESTSEGERGAGSGPDPHARTLVAQPPPLLLDAARGRSARVGTLNAGPQRTLLSGLRVPESRIKRSQRALLEDALRLAVEADHERSLTDAREKRIAAAFKLTQLLEEALVTRLEGARGHAEWRQWCRGLLPETPLKRDHGAWSLSSALDNGSRPSLFTMGFWLVVPGRLQPESLASELQRTLGVPAGLEREVRVAGDARNVIAHRRDYESGRSGVADASPVLHVVRCAAAYRLDVPAETVRWLTCLCSSVMSREPVAGASLAPSASEAL